MIKVYVYIVHSGDYSNNFLCDGVYFEYNDAKKLAEEIVDNINEEIDHEYRNIQEYYKEENMDINNIPPIYKMQKNAHNDYWSNNVEWVSIEKHLIE